MRRSGFWMIPQSAPPAKLNRVNWSVTNRGLSDSVDQIHQEIAHIAAVPPWLSNGRSIFFSFAAPLWLHGQPQRALWIHYDSLAVPCRIALYSRAIELIPEHDPESYQNMLGHATNVLNICMYKQTYKIIQVYVSIIYNHVCSYTCIYIYIIIYIYWIITQHVYNINLYVYIYICIYYVYIMFYYVIYILLHVLDSVPI